MKPLFSKMPALGIRLVITIFASIVLMVADTQRLSPLVTIRNLMENGMSFVYYIANAPNYALNGVSDNVMSNQQLLLENKALYLQLKEKNADLLLLDQLKVENQRLRLLLNSPLRQDEYKKIAQVMNVEMNNYHQQMVINQGSKDGAFVGQPVIDEKGVVGQIISVGNHSSRVLMITDISHSIPVQVLRNGARMIATGTGHSGELMLDNVQRTADIQEGDLLVTSGLSGRFPEGFPVATVGKIERDKQNYFATITANPKASISSLREVLLVWVRPTKSIQTESITPEEVRISVEKRLAQQEALNKQDHQDTKDKQ